MNFYYCGYSGRSLIYDFCLYLYINPFVILSLINKQMQKKTNENMMHAWTSQRPWNMGDGQGDGQVLIEAKLDGLCNILKFGRWY